MLQQLTVGTPGVNQCTISGLTVTVGLAPLATQSKVFSGTGLDDLTWGGAYTDTQSRKYVVEIDGTGTPDTFKWSDDGGATFTTGVAITGSAQTLSHGITVTFAATTGHTLADQWEALTESLYAFISTALGSGLESVDILGIQDGSNTAYVLDKVPPVGTHVIFRRNGVVLEEVAASPSGGQFTIAGADITVGTAFLSDDVADAWIEDTVPTVLFRSLPITITGSVVSASLTIPTGLTPRAFVLFNGIGQQQVATSPGVNQFTGTFSPTISLTLGLTPNANDWVAVYLAGAEFDEDLTAPSLLSLRQLERRLLVITDRQLDRQEARMCLDETWRYISKFAWSFLKTEGVVTTRAAKTAGTAAMVQGATFVVGTGTNWETSDIGSRFLFDQPYLIIDVDESNQILTLDAPFAGGSNPEGGYTIFKTQYALLPDVWRILTITRDQWPLTEIAQPMLNLVDPDRSATGIPYYYAYTEPTAKGVAQIELWPVPLDIQSLRYIAVTRSHLDDPAEIMADISNVVLLGGAEFACPIIANKKADAKDYQAASHWMSQMAFWSTKYQDALAIAKHLDRKRFGRTDSTYGRLFDRFTDDPGVDLRGARY